MTPPVIRMVEKKLIKDLSEEKMSLELASMGKMCAYFPDAMLTSFAIILFELGLLLFLHILTMVRVVTVLPGISLENPLYTVLESFAGSKWTSQTGA